MGFSLKVVKSFLLSELPILSDKNDLLVLSKNALSLFPVYLFIYS